MTEKRTAYSSRSLQRSAAVVDASLQLGNLTRIKDPMTLTLVGNPANQTGFKVVREDETAATQGTPMNRIRRQRRSTETNPVMKLTFPGGKTEDDVKAALADYGMTNYRIETEGDNFVAVRSDLKSIAKDGTVDVKLNASGLMATVARGEVEPPAVEGDKQHIAIAVIEFDASKYTAEEATRWAKEKGVDGNVAESQNSPESLQLIRSAVKEGDETRRMEIGDGITAVIVRSDVEDIIDTIDGVCEAAYGSWGWGQMDFMALMAGRSYNEQMRDALYALSEVTEQIMLYSQLPLDSRKALMSKALGQFDTYISSLLDALPRQLLAATVARSAKPSTENVMTQANAAEQKPATEVTPPAAAPAAAAAITREDVATMVAEAVAKALPAALEAVEVARAAASKTPAAKTPAADAEDAKDGGADDAEEDANGKKVKRSAAEIIRADIVAAVTEAVKPLQEKITALEGTTVLRSAGAGEGEEVKKVETNAGQKPTPETVFRGAIPLVRDLVEARAARK